MVATHPRTTSRLSMSCGFRGAGPSIRNPLQAAKQRSCGYVSSPISPTSVPRRGTYTSPIMLMMVGPASRNQEKVMSVYPTAALLRSLQWVSDRYVSPRDTALIEVLCYGRLQANEVIYAMGGCGATARRHSLLCLPCLL